MKNIVWWAACAAVLAASFLVPGTALAQTFTVDFSRHTGPPLVKTRFGIYQTPLAGLPDLLHSLPYLDEINVRDFRYEIGWGKPESLGFPQITGTAQKPQIDFTTLDALSSGLNKRGVTPLFALGYCPNPLKTRTEWAGWKDLPRDLTAWQNIVQSVVSHLGSGPMFEVWNEPDMPEPGGKMFFSGTPDDYGKLYAATLSGAQAARPTALVGGGAFAYDLRYFAPLKNQSRDFASIHAYDNFAGQIASLRGALGAADTTTPLFLTEYASFTDLPPNGPQSRALGAVRFFRDVRLMLAIPDLAKVYWAQWIDAGKAPGMGLLTFDGHKKALFNAFKIYGALPIDRCPVLPSDSNDGVFVMASVDKEAHRAGVVVWNENKTPRMVSIRMKKLPFENAPGVLQAFRLDAAHASSVDNPDAEDLTINDARSLPENETEWRGELPGESAVYLNIAAAIMPPAFSASRAVALPKLGALVQTRYTFFDRAPGAPYADFDAKNGAVRLNMNERDTGIAQIGAAIQNPAPRLRVRVETGGIMKAKTAILGMRLAYAVPGNADFEDEVLLPTRQESETITVDLAKRAPKNWDKKRVVITFFLRDAGRGAYALLHAAPAP